jgi:hypothetical protein
MILLRRNILSLAEQWRELADQVERHGLLRR